MEVKVRFSRPNKQAIEKYPVKEFKNIAVQEQKRTNYLKPNKINGGSDKTRHAQKNVPPNLTGWEKIESLLEEFEYLVGLNEIKELLKEIAAFVEIQKQRITFGLVAEPITLHMLFKGSPGTGKTTVARLTGKLFKELGILSKGHLVEVDRADLVGEYIGHTAHKTKEQLKKAMGGILFIDEAYSLARGGERDFGKEATDILVRFMEDKRDDLIIILAGYTQEMDAFVRSNPGLKSRFPYQLEFPNYTISELIKIADVMLKNREYYLDAEAKRSLERMLRREMLQGNISSGNARFVRNIIEKAIRRQSVRLVKKEINTKNELMVINKDDLMEGSYPKNEIYDILDISKQA